MSITRHALNRFLVIVSCLSILALLPDGVGQLYLGSLYYLKDVLAALMIVAFTVLALAARDRVSIGVIFCFAAATAPLLLAMIRGDEFTRVYAGSIVQAVALRLCFGVQFGIFVYRERLLSQLKPFGIVLLLIVVVSGLICVWESKTQSYWLQYEENETATGASLGTGWGMDEQTLRPLSLHRGPALLGAAMATGLMLSTILLCYSQRWFSRVSFLAIAILSAYSVFLATSRSFLVGGIVGTLAFLTVGKSRKLSEKFGRPLILALVAIAVFSTFVNVTATVEFVSRTLMPNTTVGSVSSTYDRIDNWPELKNTMLSFPLILVIGAPLSSFVARIASPVQICDNMILWLIFHFGILAPLFIGYHLIAPLRSAYRDESIVRPVYLAFLAQSITTGIFLDSFFYFSAVILSLAFGYSLAHKHAEVSTVGQRLPPINVAEPASLHAA